jgi:hypothetical protein
LIVVMSGELPVVGVTKGTIDATVPLPWRDQVDTPVFAAFEEVNENDVESLGLAFLMIVRKPLLGAKMHSSGFEVGAADSWLQTLISLAVAPPKSASWIVPAAWVSWLLHNGLA